MAALSKQMISSIARQDFQIKQLPAGCNRDKCLAFIDAAAEAVSAAVAQWQQTAALSGVSIMGAVASGGQVMGPQLGMLIRQRLPTSYDPLANILIVAVQDSFSTFLTALKVPGLPWYPSFAAFTGPFAPPTPNTPCPLISIAGGNAKALSKSSLFMAMTRGITPASPAGSREVLDSIADGLDKAFNAWLGTTMVTRVMGSGPVPTFSPPFGPSAGPVIGTAQMMPGGFA